MISSQALYAFLENVIRNSAKYGTNRRIGDENEDETGLRDYYLHLSLQEKEAEEKSGSEEGRPERYQLRVWDTYSGVGGDETPKDGGETIHVAHNAVNEALETSLLDKSTGELNREALGFQEMKICAESLWANPAGDRKDEHSEKGEQEFLSLANVDDSADWDPPDGATPADKRKCHKRLTFCMDIAKPVLLATVGGNQAQSQFRSPYIKTYGWDAESVEKLEASGAHMVLVNGDAKGQGESALEMLANHHTALPYRLLILCKNQEREDNLRKRVEKKRVEKKRVEKKGVIPHLRVHFFTDSELWGQVFGGVAARVANDDDQTSGESSEVPPMSDEETLIIRCYETWLRAWKPIDLENGKCWHLWIGFERQKGKLQDSWGRNLEKFDSRLIRIGAREFERNGSNGTVVGTYYSNEPDSELKGKPEDNGYWEDEIGAKHCNKRILIFDNHGKCFPQARRLTKAEDGGLPDPNGWCRFYQDFSSDNIDLCQLLEHPPSSPVRVRLVHPFAGGKLPHRNRRGGRATHLLDSQQGKRRIRCQCLQVLRKPALAPACRSLAGVYPQAGR